MKPVYPPSTSLSGGYNNYEIRIKGLLHHAQGEVRWREASFVIDWVEGKSTGAFTPPGATTNASQSHFGHANSHKQELVHWGKHAFWMLTSGSSCVSGISHQSYQSFSMLGASNWYEPLMSVLQSAFAGFFFSNLQNAIWCPNCWRWWHNQAW